MITLTFIPENDSFIQAADEYARIWKLEGRSITTEIESITQLRFIEKNVEVTVFEGKSQSHPMKLRASYDEKTKKATLVHELLHRLSSEYMLKLPIKDEDLSLGLHKHIDLVLYDLWVSLYGKAFADDQVKIESNRTAIYKEAWDWALKLSEQERRIKFAELRS